ncbi:hypothetical protein DAQ1742_02667 [Dickeya aquatica]|uniref:Uncharacterized protein n=1 Tax=Dickeya aquatica TaxID=1401087 RepID=A0A375ABV7_9GAMM|nr:hypothetical protein DAQ1742_02667 [Dickeya aquatica]
MGRVKNDQSKLRIVEGEGAEVGDNIGIYLQAAAIAKGVLLPANVCEYCPGIVAIKPEHP